MPTKKRSLKKKNDFLKRLLHRDHFSYASRIAKQYGCQDVIWKLPGDYRWLGKARPVVMKSGYYVDTQPLSIKKKSSWLQKPISLAAHKMPLNILISRLLRDTKVKVTYRNAAQPNRLVTLDYTGSLQGALQSVSEQTNYHYRLNKNNLVWFYDKNS